jgi:hypothetical protein
MHACLLQIHDYASLLFIYYDLSSIIGHGYMLQCCLNKDRFSSRLRHKFVYTLFTCFISSRMMFELLTDSLLYLYVVLTGFIAVNTELSGTTRQVPGFI